jgi:hypothetical protein
MNNKIEPTYVTFEQAKWLKEKGFNKNIVQVECHQGYDFRGDGTHLVKNGRHIQHNLFYSAPEQHQVVEFLRINHGIWIEVRHIKTFGVNRFHLIIWKYGEEDYHTIHCDNGVGYEVWDTPQAAYNAAFDYIKDKNLI